MMKSKIKSCFLIIFAALLLSNSVFSHPFLYKGTYSRRDAQFHKKDKQIHIAAQNRSFYRSGHN